MCEASRQQVSNSRKTVAFMKLFLEKGYTLDEKAENFKELVMKYGNPAEYMNFFDNEVLCHIVPDQF